jgi:hypothetical protein
MGVGRRSGDVGRSAVTAARAPTLLRVRPRPKLTTAATRHRCGQEAQRIAQAVISQKETLACKQVGSDEEERVLRRMSAALQ